MRDYQAEEKSNGGELVRVSGAFGVEGVLRMCMEQSGRAISKSYIVSCILHFVDTYEVDATPGLGARAYRSISLSIYL